VPGREAQQGNRELAHVATYERTLHASAERVWENVLDWEHLPWLHRGTFCSIEREDSGAWGWRARVGVQPVGEGGEILLELLVEREAGRYVARTLEGRGKGAEVWTRLHPVGEERTAIEVSFHVPGVPTDLLDAVGQGYVALYRRLWDEDEAMMSRRESELRAPRPTPAGSLALGSHEELRERLPLCVEVGGRRYRVLELDEGLVAHATSCPHMLGPLDGAEPDGGRIRCPWHGYLFDLRSGRSADGRGLRLPAARIEIDSAGQVTLRADGGAGAALSRGGSGRGGRAPGT
jgi:nitrite reductase/ring-hydroxylating ferredoxin subunit